MFSNGNELLKICLVLCLIKYVMSVPVISNEAEKILIRYGYLPSTDDSTNIIKDRILQKAVKNFQDNAGLEITGQLDDATLKILFLPRCGVLDKGTTDNEPRIRRYATQGRPMPHPNVTYKITKYSKRMKKNVIDETIQEAFSIWSKYTNLNFSQKKYGDTDINIRFEERIHDDFSFIDRIISSFDGPGGTLAHSYLDFDDTMQIHFDDEEYWTVDNQPGTSFLQIATHEIGHTLGLDHSKVYDSIMYPYYYDRYKNSIDLHTDDIEGIQSLYGKRKYFTFDDKKDSETSVKSSNPIKIFVDEFFRNKNRQSESSTSKSTTQKPIISTVISTIDSSTKKNFVTTSEHHGDIETTTAGKKNIDWFDEYEFTINLPPLTDSDEEEDTYIGSSNNNPSNGWLHVRRVDGFSRTNNDVDHDNDGDIDDIDNDEEDDTNEDSFYKFPNFQSFSEEVNTFFRNNKNRFFDNNYIKHGNDIGSRWRWSDNFGNGETTIPRGQTLVIAYW